MNIINEVATPLFKKKTNRIEGSINVKYSPRAKWLDDECHEKKQHYTEALKQLNMYKTLETRQVLCDKKTEYKKYVIRKRRVHKFNVMK